MYCFNCGSQNLDGSPACAQCRAALHQTTVPAVAPQIVYVMAQPPAPVEKKSGFAIAALVCGILSLSGVLMPIMMPLAMLFGMIALGKIRAEPHLAGGKKLAITGMSLGCLSIVFVVLWFLGFMALFVNAVRNIQSQ